MPVVMDMDAPLEAALREVPANEYAEADPAAERAKMAENFMIG